MKFSKNKSSYDEITQRNFGVYSKEDQKKLRSARITIVGVGCDGGMDAYILARMGIGHIKLIDFDVNETSNMNRQPMATYTTIGIPKVYAAKAIIKDLKRYGSRGMAFIPVLEYLQVPAH